MNTPKYKSKLEEKVADILGDIAVYEPEYLEYLQPEKKRRYTPDFKTKSDIYIECKGKWTYDDRQKHVLIRDQHPNKRIIIIFQNPDVRLNKKSKTTYGDWASKNNLEWYDFRRLELPKEIFHENKKNSRNRKRRT